MINCKENFEFPWNVVAFHDHGSNFSSVFHRGRSDRFSGNQRMRTLESTKRKGTVSRSSTSGGATMTRPDPRRRPQFHSGCRARAQRGRSSGNGSGSGRGCGSASGTGSLRRIRLGFGIALGPPAVTRTTTQLTAVVGVGALGRVRVIRSRITAG